MQPLSSFLTGQTAQTGLKPLSSYSNPNSSMAQQNMVKNIAIAHQAMRQQMSQDQGTPLIENDTRSGGSQNTFMNFGGSLGTGIKQTGQALAAPISGGAKNVKNIAQGVGQSFSQATQQTGQDFNQAMQGNKSAFSAGFQAVGHFAKAAVSPITQTVSAGANDIADTASNIPAVQNFANSKVGSAIVNTANVPVDKYNQWAQQHPEAAKNLEALGNIAQLGTMVPAGGEIGAMAKTGLDTTAEAAKPGLNAVKSDIGKMSAIGQKGLDYLKTKGDAMTEAKGLKGAIDLVQPQMNKKLAINTLKQTGTKFGGAEEKGILGSVTPKATPKIESVATDVKGLISKNKSPVKNITSLNNEIGRMSEQELRPGLQANKTLVKNTRAMQRIDQLVPTRQIKSETSLTNTYNQVKDLMAEKIAQFSKDSKSIDSESLWDARKQFDQEVEQQFGDTIYNPERNSAVKAAVRDIRTQMNEMIGEINPQYRGQLKKLNSMYTARDTIAENNYKLLTGSAGKFAAFKAEHPIATKIAKGATEVAGVGAIYEGAKKILGH